MKQIKKILAIVLTCALIFAVAVPAANAAGYKGNYTLRFNQEGNFRILQFSDTQDDVDARPAMKEFIGEAVQKLKPDLVVFTGDNTAGGGSITKTLAKASISAIIEPVRKLSVPFAIVFGNHDSEGLLSKEQLLDIYQDYNNCLAYDAVPGLYGCATYNLPILASNSNDVKFNLWMFDSNTYEQDEALGGYDYVHDDQVKWYEDTSDMLKAANGNAVVPSLAFQHIIPREIYDCLKDVPAGTPGAISRDIYDDATGKFVTRTCVLDPAITQPGSTLREAPCPSTRYSKQFDSFIQKGDVLGVVTGHDHVNSFIVHHPSGIDFIQTPGIGYQTYGDDQRGCRVIDLTEGKAEYKTETFTFFDIMGTTRRTLMLSYFSENVGWLYASYLFLAVPIVGQWLSMMFLEAVYDAKVGF